MARVYGAKLDFLRHTVRQVQLLLKLARAHNIEKARIVLTGILESFPVSSLCRSSPRAIGPTGRQNQVRSSNRARGIRGHKVAWPLRRIPDLAFQNRAAALPSNNGHEASLSEMTVTSSGHWMPRRGSLCRMPPFRFLASDHTHARPAGAARETGVGPATVATLLLGQSTP